MCFWSLSWTQMLRTQLQIRLQQPRKGYKNNFRKELKNKSGKWSMTTKSFMCSKNFEERDFVYYTNDTNKCRNRKLQQEKLEYRYLKNGAYPIKFPNYPSNTSKKKPAERPSLGSLDAREKISVQILESKRLSELEVNTVRSMNDICSFLNESDFVELTALDYKVEIIKNHIL